MARPPKYSESDKPVSVSLRIPRDLYDEAQHHAHRRQTTLTALIVEGLRLRLETPIDPRDIVASQDNTVMQELQQMIDARIAVALAAQTILTPAPAHVPLEAPSVELTHGSNAVMQQSDETTDTLLDFDTDKFHLGPLCNHEHEYGHTGKSLRRNHRNKNQQHCLECVRANNRAYHQNKRQQKAQPSP